MLISKVQLTGTLQWIIFSLEIFGQEAKWSPEHHLKSGLEAVGKLEVMWLTSLTSEYSHEANEADPDPIAQPRPRALSALLKLPVLAGLITLISPH